jgi:ribosomal RNA-processing protein 12
MHGELFSTLLVFLQSANREIVKAVLGYVKLVVHALPVAFLRPRLGALVPALLRWSHPGKNAFKTSVRHTLERVVRRFGWDDVYAAAADDEAGRKVLLNVRKRKERAKKKRAAGAAQEEDEDEPPRDRAAPAGDAFEDVLYGSESELGDSDDEDGGDAPPAKARPAHGARLRADDDDPTDLLAGAARALATRGERRRSPGADAARFRTDAESGRMVIDGSDASDAEGGAAEDVAGGAYAEALTGADGFARGPDGRVKFHKDTKKRRRAAAEAEDVEMGEPAPAAPSPGKRPRRREEPRLGGEFKAKVRLSSCM